MFSLHPNTHDLPINELRSLVGDLFILGLLHRRNGFEPLSQDGVLAWLRERYARTCKEEDLARFHAVYLAAFE